MQKNKIITYLIICAAIFSALAGYLIYRYMSPARETIYIFNDSYQAGQQLTSSMLTPIQVDASALAAGKHDSVGNYFITPTDINEVIRSGDSLKIDVSKGMPITNTMLSVSGGSTIEMNMKTDAIAVSIPVTQYTGITNDLKEGARVNIYYTSEGYTRLIQQNKRILEVFKSEGTIIGVAIEESLDESMELVNAQTNGNIYLGLVDAKGYQAAEGEDPYYIIPSMKTGEQQNLNSQVVNRDFAVGNGTQGNSEPEEVNLGIDPNGTSNVITDEEEEEKTESKVFQP